MPALQRWSHGWPTIVLLTAITEVIVGCASPASPRPPSLHLPEPVHDLSAARSGAGVELRFTVPSRTTDGQSLRGTLQGSLCRQAAASEPCRPVTLAGSEATLQGPGNGSPSASVLWTDTLPPDLASGPLRPLGYRVTLHNAEGRTAGPSDEVYTAAGAAPSPVDHFMVEGVRTGVLLRWAAAGNGDIVIAREQIEPERDSTKRSQGGPGKGTAEHTSFPHPRAERSRHEAAITWLGVNAEGRKAGATIDHSAVEGVRYRYFAVRQLVGQADGRTLEVRSVPSPAVEVVWRDVFPPAAPQGLSALGYGTGQAPGADGYAVDLVWEPVQDARILGYVVTRQAVNAGGEDQGQAQRLTAAPIPTPGFHDAMAAPDQGYRYSVIAVDAKGNQSTAATAVVRARQP